MYFKGTWTSKPQTLEPCNPKPLNPKPYKIEVHGTLFRCILLNSWECVRANTEARELQVRFTLNPTPKGSLGKYEIRRLQPQNEILNLIAFEALWFRADRRVMLGVPTPQR